jgi:cell division septum initiation protein DivIVA
MEETDEPDAEEEAEELRQVLKGDTESAGGFTYEEIAQAIGAADNPADEKAQAAAGKVFYTLEKTDLFEQLISSDGGRAARINAVLERYTGSIIPQAQETEDKEQDTEYRNFDMTAFLS